MSKAKNFPLWVRILLWFKKPIRGFDYGYTDPSCVVTCKTLFGRIYVMSQEFFVADPKGGEK